jgi:outer membrane lipoprotein-sorting protein
MKKILLITILTTLVFNVVAQNNQARQQRREQNKTFTQHGVDDPAAHTILRDVRRNLKSFNSLRFEFTFLAENRTDRSQNDIQKGTMLLKGDKYKLEFMGQTMISDGKTVWSLNPNTKEVHISQVNPRDTETLNPLALLENYEKNYRAKLIREDQDRGVDVMIIDLQPFEGRSFHKVRILTDKTKKTIVSTEIHEKSGTVLTFRVDRMQTNVSAPDSGFKFDASRHPGFEVIDMR